MARVEWHTFMPAQAGFFSPSELRLTRTHYLTFAPPMKKPGVNRQHRCCTIHTGPDFKRAGDVSRSDDTRRIAHRQRASIRARPPCKQARRVGNADENGNPKADSSATESRP
jgi:hypothetical protein